MFLYLLFAKDECDVVFRVPRSVQRLQSSSVGAEQLAVLDTFVVERFRSWSGLRG